LSHAHRLGRISKGVFHDNGVVAFAKNKANGRLVACVLELVVDRGKIEVHFTCELRFELLDLKLKNHEAAQAQMIE